MTQQSTQDGPRMVVRPIYLLITDKHGKAHVEERMAWDAERLFDAVFDQYHKEGGMVQATTAERYHEYRRANARRR